MADTINASMDETARIILMDLRSEGVRNLLEFSKRMRAEYPNTDSTSIAMLHTKYEGMDRIRPTHDVDTGERISR